jgi:hypothetical protein
MLSKWFSDRGGRTAARHRSPRGIPRRPVLAAVALVLLVPQLTGCFQYVQVAGPAVPVGAEVTLGVTDRGRIALTEPVGPGVRRLSGRVLESTDTTLVLGVKTVEFLDLGVPVQWAGQPVRIAREHVTEVRERQLSRSRTYLAIGLSVAAVAALSLIGINTVFGDEPGPPRPPGERDPD